MPKSRQWPRLNHGHAAGIVPAVPWYEHDRKSQIFVMKEANLISKGGVINVVEDVDS